MTDHLKSLGAKSISDEDYQKLLKNALSDPASFL
jgi:Leu/Phe-tRNA-protein transferase